MINKEQKQVILRTLVESLELPEYAYEQAIKRYEDLGEWFDREESLIKANNPHVFPQGSFMLGTAIRPIDETDEYDIDLVCKLRKDFNKDTHTQETLKNIVGEELELYRKARGIKEKLESKHRCWCLNYQDDLNFHMDILPCIPSDENTQGLIFGSMERVSWDTDISGEASEKTILITDDRHISYSNITDDWEVSNPEGYRIWFKKRMSVNQTPILSANAQVDSVPIYKRKTTLQRAVQLLKRHRDQMFRDNDSKPISIIITTLAGRAYNGERDLEVAILNILTNMGKYIFATAPRIPNPVNPNEDFADRWSMSEYEDLDLENNFRNWVQQAKIDFRHILSGTDEKFISNQAKLKFSVNIKGEHLSKELGLIDNKTIPVKPKEHTIIDPPKPWKIEDQNG